VDKRTKKEAAMNRIEFLTEEQMAREEEFFQKWIQIGLCCDPANRTLAEAAIRDAYATDNLPPPKVISWHQSPLAALTAVRKIDKEASWSSSAYGQHDASWLSFYDFMGQVVGLTEEVKELDALIRLAQTCGWVWFYDQEAFACERTSMLKLDDQGNLHCEDGPACEYPDGFSLFAYHGTLVPDWVILHHDQITLKKIKAEENAEVRRVMREIYGEGRYLEDIGAKLIDADVEGAIVGSAPRALQEDDEGRRFVVWTDGSTGRVYHNEVPPNTKTCAEAHRALCGFDESRIVSKS